MKGGRLVYSCQQECCCRCILPLFRDRTSKFNLRSSTSQGNEFELGVLCIEKGELGDKQKDETGCKIHHKAWDLGYSCS